MKLEETAFDRIDIGDECIFRNEFGICIHAIKISREKIMRKADASVAYTGQFHKVFKITDPFSKSKPAPSPKNSKRIRHRLQLYRQSLRQQSRPVRMYIR